MGSLTDVIDIVLRVVFPVLTVVVSGACVLLFGGFTTVKSTNEEQGKRIRFLEEERDRLAEERAAEREKDAEERRVEREKYAHEFANLRAEAEVLRKTVTGEIHLVAITDLLTHHHDQAVQIWTTLAENHQAQEQRLVVLTAAVESVDSNLDALGANIRELITVMAAERESP
jgi:Tfp pilus assembly protein PilN